MKSFKEKVKYYIENEYQPKKRIDEMALKDLKGTEELWDAGDLEGVADKYIENALANYDKDKFTYKERLSNIKRGLTATFKSKTLGHRADDIEELKGIIRRKVEDLQKNMKTAKDEE